MSVNRSLHGPVSSTLGLARGEHRMTCIDCYLAPVPIENRAACDELARISARVLRESCASTVQRALSSAGWMTPGSTGRSFKQQAHVTRDCRDVIRGVARRGHQGRRHGES